MRAITVNEYGATPALTEVPDPQPAPGQVLIKVEAAGVNPVDRVIADGGFKELIPASFPLILGVDLAGVVEAAGEGASRFSEGDRVFGLLMIPPLGSTGTYAEYVVVGEDAPLARIPEGLDPSVAAALPSAGGVAFAIVEQLEPLSDKTVVLVGAAGGIGSFATQLAAKAGARVIAVARASANSRMRAYGAEETVDHTAVSVPDALQRTYPNGIDVLIDVASDEEELARLASFVRRGGIVMPPITRIELDDVPALNGTRSAGGKTVITFADAS